MIFIPPFNAMIAAANAANRKTTASPLFRHGTVKVVKLTQIQEMEAVFFHWCGIELAIAEGVATYQVIHPPTGLAIPGVGGATPEIACEEFLRYAGEFKGPGGKSLYEFLLEAEKDTAVAIARSRVRKLKELEGTDE